jgi:hypothetical protein
MTTLHSLKEGASAEILKLKNPLMARVVAHQANSSLLMAVNLAVRQFMVAPLAIKPTVLSLKLNLRINSCNLMAGIWSVDNV